MESHNAKTLMKRLEAATSRLEDLVEILENKQPTDSPSEDVRTYEKNHSSPVRPSTSSPNQLNKETSKMLQPSNALSNSMEHWVTTFEDLTSNSKTIDSLLFQQMETACSATKTTVEMILRASQSKKPDLKSAEYTEFVKSLSSKISQVIEIRENNRNSKYTSFLAMVAEGIPALGWVTSEKPADYVQEFKDSAQFWANRVLKEVKEKPDQIQWTRSFMSALLKLKDVIEADYVDGLPWNQDGEPLAVVSSSAHDSNETNTRAASPTKTGPPSPPVPSSVNLPRPASISAAETNSGSGSMSCVFDDLSKGTKITSALRHVDRAAVKEGLAKQPPRPGPKPGHKVTTKTSIHHGSAQAKSDTTPNLRQDEDRWIVENFIDNDDIMVESKMGQSILIDSCHDSKVSITGKPTQLTITKCSKLAVVVESLVANVEIIKSHDFGIQITGTLPSLMIDQSHNGQIYLSKDALEIDIFTSQTSTINIYIPGEEGEGHYTECHLPEQILHRINGTHVKSSAVTSGR